MSTGIYIGTSGWHYQITGKGPFYPEDLTNTGFLEHYAGCFDTAEINNSFYRLPEEKTLAGWRDTVPEGFVFSVKASRYLTHMKKLKGPAGTAGKAARQSQTPSKKSSGRSCSSYRPAGR